MTQALVEAANEPPPRHELFLLRLKTRLVDSSPRLAVATGGFNVGTKSVYCHERRGHITLETDRDGVVCRVICPKYENSTGLCRIRHDTLEGGPLSQLLERNTLNARTTRCDFEP
jgi:hypothetical protein